MNAIRFTLSLFAVSIGLATGQESIPLWPEGKTPFAKDSDAETGRPKLYLYPVANEKKRSGCAVVVCPGGGYGGLAADHEGHQIGKWLNDRGIAAFVLHYRLGSRGHHFPTQLADVQRAIRRVRAGAEEYRIDPERIGVMGFSAGGHLASMAATKFDERVYEPSDGIDEASARPDFAVLCYAVISTEEGVGHMGSRRNLLGPDKAADAAAARQVSSELNVTGKTPPTFLFHTGEDKVVLVENALRFYRALQQYGIASEMHIYQRGPHGVGLFQGDPVLGTWSERLHDWIRTNGFLAAEVERVAVEGTVTLDGHPVSWGTITFHPEDIRLPRTTARIRNGRFKADKENGPAISTSELSFSGSIWEQTRNPADRVVQLDRLSPGEASPVTIEVKAGMDPLSFDLKSR